MSRWQPIQKPVATMVGISLTVALFLWLIGAHRTALASLASMPLSLFHSWLTKSAIMKSDSSSKVVLRSLTRTTLSITALAIAAYYGTEILIGVLIGLSLEALSYIVYSVRLVIRR